MTNPSPNLLEERLLLSGVASLDDVLLRHLGPSTLTSVLTEEMTS